MKILKNNKALLALLAVATMTVSASAAGYGQVENGVQEQQRMHAGKSAMSNQKHQTYQKQNKRKKMIRTDVRKQVKMNVIKVKYLTKLNQIEQCVLMADTREDMKICNQRVKNLSRDLNKMEQRGKKQRQKQKRFQR